MTIGTGPGPLPADAETVAAIWLKRFLAERGLERPSGRPLYAYRPSPDDVGRLRDVMRRVRAADVSPHRPRIGAVFCLWASAWFRHRFAGGSWTWDGLRAELVDLGLEPAEIETLVVAGLGWWRRPLARDGRGRLFLASVVVEGGLPEALITQGRGWLQPLIEATLLALEADRARDDAAASRHAEAHLGLAPNQFRGATLAALVADLATILAELRAQARAAGVKAGVAAWLDGRDPAWRGRLPLGSGTEAARVLVDGLVRAEPGRRLTPLAARRILQRRPDGAWAPGLRLAVAGRLDPGWMPLGPGMGDANRVRLLPAGALAAHGLTALGVAEREAESPVWQVRSHLRDDPAQLDAFPLDAAVEAVSASGALVSAPWTLPGGQPVASEVLVFRSDEPDEGEPGRLVLAATGSVRLRAGRAWVLAPRHWRVEGEAPLVGEVGGSPLREVAGPVRLVAPDGEFVQVSLDRPPGAGEAEGERLAVGGRAPPGLRAPCPIIAGRPEVCVERAGGLRTRPERLKLRAGRAGPWRPADGAWPLGLVELRLEDAAGATLDRARLIRLPAEARLTARRGPDGTCQVTCLGLEGARVAIEGAPGARPVPDGAVLGADVPGSRVRLRLAWPGGEAALDLAVSGEGATFHDRDDAALRDASLSLAELRGAYARSDSPAEICLELRARGERPLRTSRPFEGELPFSQLADALSRLFASTTDLDATVRAEALFGGRRTAHLTLLRQDLAFARQVPSRDGAFTFDPASTLKLMRERPQLIEIVGRPFARWDGPEHVLAAPGIEDLFQTVAVPAEAGPWFVHARIDGVARARPIVLMRGPAPADLDPLPAALAVADHAEREAALRDLLARTAHEPPLAAALAAALAGLDPGLPLQALDVLRLLPDLPGAAAAMAVHAADEHLDRVLDIQDRLPLTWATTPFAAWTGAVASRHRMVAGQIGSVGLRPDLAASLVAEDVQGRLRRIVARRPSLAVHLAGAARALGLAPAADAPDALRDAHALLGMPAAGLDTLVRARLAACCQERLRDNDETWPRPLDFAAKIPGLPGDHAACEPWQRPVLDAPLVAAELAAGRAAPGPALERALRECRAFARRTFDAALPFALARARLRSDRAGPAQARSATPPPSPGMPSR